MNSTNNLKDAWNYIEEWLDSVAKNVDRMALNKGTTTEELALFESNLNVKMPSDFRDSYLIHDGFKEKIGLFHGADLLSLSEIKMYYYRILRGNSTKEWDFIPILMYNEYAFFCINLKDNQLYDVVINYEDGSVLSEKLHFVSSFSDLITKLANDLKNGNGSMEELLS